MYHTRLVGVGMYFGVVGFGQVILGFEVGVLTGGHAAVIIVRRVLVVVLTSSGRGVFVRAGMTTSS